MVGARGRRRLPSWPSPATQPVLRTRYGSRPCRETLNPTTPSASRPWPRFLGYTATGQVPVEAEDVRRLYLNLQTIRLQNAPGLKTWWPLVTFIVAGCLSWLFGWFTKRDQQGTRKTLCTIPVHGHDVVNAQHDEWLDRCLDEWDENLRRFNDAQ